MSTTIADPGHGARLTHRGVRSGAPPQSGRPRRFEPLAVDPARFHFFDPETGAIVARAARATEPVEA